MIELSIRKNNHIYCNIFIKLFNSPTIKPISFRVDTGADNSTISKDTLVGLGYNAEWMSDNIRMTGGTMTTASGESFRSCFVPLKISMKSALRGIEQPFAILLDKKIEPPRQGCADCEYIGTKKADYINLLVQCCKRVSKFI